MKKTFLIPILYVFLLVAGINAAMAQFNILASSAPFTEPEEGFAKILLMKNGNSFFAHLKENGGIDVRIYDTQHKELAATSFATNYGDMKKASVKGCFELNGDVTLLIMEMVGWSYAMYRVVIDGNTGMKKEEIVFKKMDDFSMSGYKDVRKGNADMPDFIVRKDPNSENYAVCINNSASKDKSKRINLIHFDRFHKEISNVYINAALIPGYEYCKPADLVVNENKEVMIMIEVFNRVKDEKKGELKLLRFMPGNAAPTILTPPFPKNKSLSETSFKFNRDYTKLFMFALIYESREKETILYNAQLIELNMSNLSFTDKKLDFGDALSLIRAKYPKYPEFNLIPVGLQLKQDGGFTVMFESTATLTVYGDVLTSLGNILVSDFDDAGNLLSGSAILTERKADGQSFPLLYQNHNEEGAIQLKNGNQYKLFRYLQTPKGNFVLMNDMEDNGNLNDKGDIRKTFVAVRSAYPYYYKIGDALPVRQWFYPKPADDRHPVCMFQVSDYDYSSNVFCTTQLDHGGGGGKIKIVWLTPS